MDEFTDEEFFFEEDEQVYAADDADFEEPELEPDTPEEEARQEQVGYDIIKAAAGLPVVKIDRELFLRAELKKRCPKADIDLAIATSPREAGISQEDIDLMATDAINVETGRCTGISFVAGIPGGLGMLATVPADVTQYLAHAMRIEQKLAYLYGWGSFLNDENQVDDRTLMEFTMLLGVMMGVGSAATALNAFAANIARVGVQKTIEKQALTKTLWYPVLKKVLRVVGVKVTKKSFANAAGKLMPVLGGGISAGMTFVTFRPSAERLRKYLRTLPISGFDPDTPVYIEPTALNKAGEAVGTAAQNVAGAATGAVTTGLQAAGGLVGSLLQKSKASTEEPPAAAAATAVDPYEELKKMKELLDLGIVTPEEFDAKKKQLLGL